MPAPTTIDTFPPRTRRGGGSTLSRITDALEQGFILDLIGQPAGMDILGCVCFIRR